MLQQITFATIVAKFNRQFKSKLSRELTPKIPPDIFGSISKTAFSVGWHGHRTGSLTWHKIVRHGLHSKLEWLETVRLLRHIRIWASGNKAISSSQWFISIPLVIISLRPGIIICRNLLPRSRRIRIEKIGMIRRSRSTWSRWRWNHPKRGRLPWILHAREVRRHRIRSHIVDHWSWSWPNSSSIRGVDRKRNISKIKEN